MYLIYLFTAIRSVMICGVYQRVKSSSSPLRGWESGEKTLSHLWEISHTFTNIRDFDEQIISL